MSSTHNDVPWLEGDALETFLALGGQPMVGDEVIFSKERAVDIQQRDAAYRGAVCRVLSAGKHYLILESYLGGGEILAVSKRIHKLRRMSCLVTK